MALTNTDTKKTGMNATESDDDDILTIISQNKSVMHCSLKHSILSSPKFQSHGAR